MVHDTNISALIELSLQKLLWSRIPFIVLNLITFICTTVHSLDLANSEHSYPQHSSKDSGQLIADLCGTLNPFLCHSSLIVPNGNSLTFINSTSSLNRLFLHTDSTLASVMRGSLYLDVCTIHSASNHCFFDVNASHILLSRIISSSSFSSSLVVCSSE